MMKIHFKAGRQNLREIYRTFVLNEKMPTGF